jgi:peptidoglycan/LPS O-acetylase OafA/YrhL
VPGESETVQQNFQVKMNLRSRYDLVDAFRGIAIIRVMIFHYFVVGLKWEPEEIFRLGKLGVEVFFVISGLVITMTALGSNNPVDFSIKRFARIYPTFLVCATFTWVLTHIYDPLGQSVGAIDYVVTLSLLAERVGFRFVDGAYWSLLVEIQFYIIVAASVFALKDKFWIGVLVALIFGAIIRPWNKPIAALLFSSYSSFFLIGMATWYGAIKGNRRAAILLFFGSLITFLLGPQIGIQWPALFPVAVFVVLFSLRIDMSFGPLAWIGRISYPLYLIHQVLGLNMIAGLNRLGVDGGIAVIFTSATAITIAAGLHYGLEMPVQKIIVSRWNRWRGSNHGTKEA